VRGTAEERFWAKVAVPEDRAHCWLWTAHTNHDGYGRFGGPVPGRLVYAHRFSYELHIGPTPDGLVLDHLCRTPACVNPAHLEPVTDAENIRRGRGIAARRAAQTHCVNGHPFDDANTIRRAGGNRGCRACHRIANQSYKARKRAEQISA
jgi:hypothetical protein